ncbi:hypothetical protein PENARI_c006G02527 [Penicillium arizonense]|uniref:DJ-1/PfpI domain-containing protein n=1 Tax=Penicillium arizonense TaxID=1835702 RepID=A0A1F5LM97_PENAI|nr:hypothetical protein PENARI_c006G02527 [Penicillium arizonense]OGE54216.1 hypothetical protein PENARI_c006G02527 [Penicillium arizonense]
MSQVLRIGVLLVGSVQLLDLAAVDLLYMATPEYLNSSSLTQALIDMGRPCQIHYIGQGGASNMTPATAQMSIQLTDAPTDEAVSPGKLDVVIVPGPSLKAMPPAEEYLDFVRGITNGHDLVVEYLRENYPAPLINAVIVQADITPRLVHYSSPATINAAK